MTAWLTNRLIEAALTVFAAALEVMAWIRREPRT